MSFRRSVKSVRPAYGTHVAGIQGRHHDRSASSGMIGLLLVLQVIAFKPLQDSVALRSVADSVGVPVNVMYAVAWMESRDGHLGNKPRGPGREQCDSLGCRRVCREIGRLQINPCIRWKGLPCSDIRVYENNLRCGAAIL